MRKSVMIVDDSEDTRELFKAALESEGFSVVGAKSGPEALELIRKDGGSFSLILLDIAMPQMTGIQVLEEMERLGIGRDIPVMLVSAVDNLGTLEAPGNVIDTLKKPFFYPELIFKIKQQHGVMPA